MPSEFDLCVPPTLVIVLRYYIATNAQTVKVIYGKSHTVGLK